MSSEKFNIFTLGATGYVGGTLLVHIRANFPNAHITALVRSEKDNAVVRDAGVNHILQGSHQDLDKIRAAVAEADIVFNPADCDDVALTRAILDGMRERHQKTGKKPILIHTGGTAVAMDDSKGDYRASAAWNDLDEEFIKNIKETQLHRNVDLEIFKADEEGFVDGYVICPPTIYGRGSGPKNQISIQIPLIIKTQLKHGKGFYVGEGTSIWNHVHIDDLMDVYRLVLAHAVNPSVRAKKSTPFSKFYFVEAGTHVWGEVSRRVAAILHRDGLLKSAETVSLSWDEAKDIDPWLIAVSTNSTVHANRVKALGWKPTRPNLYDTLEADVKDSLKEIRK